MITFTELLGVARCRAVAVAAGFMALAFIAGAPQEASAQNTCNPDTSISGSPGGPFVIPSPTITITLEIGAGNINNGTTMTIPSVAYALDCDNDGVLPCTDDGGQMTYLGDGTISTTCTDGSSAISWTTGHGVGTAPNDITFTPTSPVVVNANSTCDLEFNVMILTASTDATPTLVEVAAGYAGACNNGLNATGQPTAAFETITCEVDLDKFVCVDTDDDGTTDVCFGAGEAGGVGANLEGKLVEWFVDYENTGSGDLSDCTVGDTAFGAVISSPFALAASADPAPVEINSGLCSADIDNTATITCNMCEGQSIETTDSDDASVDCLACSASLDKQVSCDNLASVVDVTDVDDEGGTNIESCDAWLDDDEVGIRYVYENTGDVDLVSCVLVDTNPTLSPSNPNDADVEVGDGPMDIEINPVECTTPFEDGEPHTAMLDCTCAATIGGVPIQTVLGLSEDIPNFGSCGTSAQDSANVECLSVVLDINKTCEEQVDDDNAISITVTNNGEADLANCVATDTLDPLGAATDIPLSCDDTGGDGDNTFDLASGSATVTCTGTAMGLTEDTDNDVDVVCDIVGSDGKTVEENDSDICEAGEGCFTRTPGFWGTHPAVTDLFLPLVSCGIDIDNVVDATNGSAIEDMCSVGRDSKRFSNDDDNNQSTSNQQVQLERQCMAAQLNLAATAFFGGSCDTEFPGMAVSIASCCGLAVDDVSTCNGGNTPADISASECIEKLDMFNNLSDPEDPVDTISLCPNTDLGTVAPCNAEPGECRDSKNNRFLNPGRDRGPRNN